MKLFILSLSNCLATASEPYRLPPPLFPLFSLPHYISSRFVNPFAFAVVDVCLFVWLVVCLVGLVIPLKKTIHCFGRIHFATMSLIPVPKIDKKKCQVSCTPWEFDRKNPQTIKFLTITSCPSSFISTTPICPRAVLRIAVLLSFVVCLRMMALTFLTLLLLLCLSVPIASAQSFPLSSSQPLGPSADLVHANRYLFSTYAVSTSVFPTAPPSPSAPTDLLYAISGRGRCSLLRLVREDPVQRFVLADLKSSSLALPSNSSAHSFFFGESIALLKGDYPVSNPLALTTDLGHDRLWVVPFNGTAFLPLESYFLKLGFLSASSSNNLTRSSLSAFCVTSNSVAHTLH